MQESEVRAMTGIQYITNDKGEKTAAVIDLKKHGELMEDFLDLLVCEQRKDEPTIPWEQVKAELVAAGKLRD